MFKTLEDVIIRWQERFNYRDRDGNLPSSFGYTPEKIQALESDLGFEFHPSVRAVIQKMKPTRMFLAGFTFHGGALVNEPYSIQEKKRIDFDSDCATPEQANLTREDSIYVGWSDRCMYDVWANNKTGHLYFVDPESKCSTKLAENFETFLCIAASTNDYLWPRVETLFEANRVSLSWLEQNRIEVGQPFWLSLIADAASYPFNCSN
jgi:hypothetical protein